MKPETRLALIGLVIVFSAVYAALAYVDSNVAQTIGVGYVAVLTTTLAAVQIGKKLHDRQH